MIDVLVVGAGPTGLVLASELLRHGLTCRVIDQLAEPVTFSKAAVVHARTMELFDSMGIAEDVIAKSRLIHGVNIYAQTKRVAHVDLGGLDTPYPHVYGISQFETEGILRAHLGKLGGTVERGVHLDGFEQRGESVRAKTGGGDVDARWIVGCDGAHSKVREVLKLSFDGSAYEEGLVQADVRIAWPRDVPEDEILLFLGDRRELAFFPLFADGRYRFIIFDTAGEGGTNPTLATFQAALDAQLPGATVSDPAWIAGFRIHHRRASHYRAGRAFIAGDAAHIHSPAGGQGMNTGIQDVVNLAWKLALVHRGVAHASVLDSYEAERAPIAKALLASTDSMTRAAERAVAFRHPVATALRNRAIGFVTGLSVVQSRVQRNLSMLEVGYADSPIVTQDRKSVLQTNLIARAGADGEEDPGLRDWAAFGDAPAPGARAYPVELPDLGGTMVHPMRDRRHVALLFDGAAATDAGYLNLASIASAIAARCGDEIAIHIIVPGTARPAALTTFGGSVLLDADGDLHRRYGARSECLYLVRPDGYVAYRTQPADGAKLVAYLDRIFTPLP